MRTSSFQQIRLILLRHWDPIGITQMREYREATEDEYDSYALELATMLERGVSIEDVYGYLNWASKEHMGLSIIQEDTARHAAELIMQISK